MWKLLKFFFFKFDAEKAHYLSMNLLAVALKIPVLSHILKNSFKPKEKIQPIAIDGLIFPNKLGLAAGFDKDGRWLDLLSELGFGFIELGTVTPMAQYGNDKPRLFRLIEDEAIINRMGFNNDGVEALVEKLKKFKNKNKIVLGGNIGKNKNTTNEDAVKDYAICFQKLFDYVDYFTVNVSSPNTANLRGLQEKEPLIHLLSNLQELNLAKQYPKPIYLKIAPDLNEETLSDIIEVVKTTRIHGIVANNTTISRSPELKDKVNKSQSGGLSGAPLNKMSKDLLLKIAKDKSFTIISVGGIINELDALERLNSGADLVQVYTGMIYNGPWWIKRIIEKIR